MASPKSGRKGERAFHGGYPGLAGRYTNECILTDTHGNLDLRGFMITGCRLMTVGYGGCYGRTLQSGGSLREVLNFAWERQVCLKCILKMSKILVVGQMHFWLESLCDSMERTILHRKEGCA